MGLLELPVLLAQIWLCFGFQDLPDQHPKPSLMDNLLAFTARTQLMRLLMVEVLQSTPSALMCLQMVSLINLRLMIQIWEEASPRAVSTPPALLVLCLNLAAPRSLSLV